ncbi:hypothetical protein [Tenacibaculum piscium]|uniref:hypothetical protein n=1 Tax=Tenacibaculum piscium TaxID=1458515 RepID=UPI001F3A72FD|nr:hypothetical protein [Tenacibaculum piscium]
MIKEIFEIEPIQKNSLIMFVGIFCLSFLQLYLFKNETLDKGVFIVTGLCLSLAVCWSIINILPLLFFSIFIEEKEKNNGIKIILIAEKIVFFLGLMAIGWTILLTYICYELDFCFKNFIRVSILASFIRTLFWFICLLTLGRKKT